MNARAFISDEEIDRALDFLRDSADDAAKARAERIYLEEYRKSLKAVLMKEHDGKAIGIQEREAYADQNYVRHLEAIKDAVFKDEKLRFLRTAAEAKIEAWRSASANYRSMKI